MPLSLLCSAPRRLFAFCASARVSTFRLFLIALSITILFVPSTTLRAAGAATTHQAPTVKPADLPIYKRSFGFMPWRVASLDPQTPLAGTESAVTKAKNDADKKAALEIKKEQHRSALLAGEDTTEIDLDDDGETPTPIPEEEQADADALFSPGKDHPLGRQSGKSYGLMYLPRRRNISTQGSKPYNTEKESKELAAYKAHQAELLSHISQYATEEITETSPVVPVTKLRFAEYIHFDCDEKDTVHFADSLNDPVTQTEEMVAYARNLIAYARREKKIIPTEVLAKWAEITELARDKAKLAAPIPFKKKEDGSDSTEINLSEHALGKIQDACLEIALANNKSKDKSGSKKHYWEKASKAENDRLAEQLLALQSKENQNQSDRDRLKELNEALSQAELTEKLENEINSTRVQIFSRYYDRVNGDKFTNPPSSNLRRGVYGAHHDYALDNRAVPYFYDEKTGKRERALPDLFSFGTSPHDRKHIAFALARFAAQRKLMHFYQQESVTRITEHLLSLACPQRDENGEVMLAKAPPLAFMLPATLLQKIRSYDGWRYLVVPPARVLGLITAHSALIYAAESFFEKYPTALKQQMRWAADQADKSGKSSKLSSSENAAAYSLKSPEFVRETTSDRSTGKTTSVLENGLLPLTPYHLASGLVSLPAAADMTGEIGAFVASGLRRFFGYAPRSQTASLVNSMGAVVALATAAYTLFKKRHDAAFLYAKWVQPEKRMSRSLARTARTFIQGLLTARFIENELRAGWEESCSREPLKIRELLLAVEKAETPEAQEATRKALEAFVRESLTSVTSASNLFAATLYKQLPELVRVGNLYEKYGKDATLFIKAEMKAKMTLGIADVLF